MLALLLNAGTAAAQTAADFATFDQNVAKSVRAWNSAGLAIAIVSGDSLVFAKGYGLIEKGKPALVNEHTRFAIGSTTKAMTSAALAMLADEGKIHWDDRVSTYLPDLRLEDPYASHELTIRDILTHRSGLPSTDLMWSFDENTVPFDTLIHRLRYVHPASSFRSMWDYQNVVYAIGGAVIERVSGMKWDAFIRTRIFAPLGMNESEALVSQIRGKANVGVPHAVAGDSLRVVEIRSTDMVAPAGSVYSSVSDMSKWMRFVLDSGRVGDKRLISIANFRELIAPQIRAPMEQYPALQLSRPNFFSYGFGWFIQDYRSQAVWMHTGSINGMSALIGLLPDKKMGVYVLANTDHVELRHALMYQAFDLYTPGVHRDWSKELLAVFKPQTAPRAAASAATATPPKAARPLERYAGVYVDSTYGTVTVKVANDSISARFERLDIGALELVDGDIYRKRQRSPSDARIVLSFVPNETGAITAVRLGGATFTRVRR